ncbi:MAG TPA: hydantoinase/oxoprolinase family protein, partial [Reyranella sp.]|nr:hydantoinase/oxoprolinase family protein [Reyranella sp.]
MRLIGVDVGGTFTDLVYADTDAGSTAVHKISTTPDDPSRGVVQGLMALCDKYGIPRETIDVVFHGTTIATNAILEHDGAVTGMITTGGYRDILHIGRHQRPQHYSIMQDIPWQSRPLVKRRHRKTVTERLVPPRGEVLEPLDEEGVRQAVRELKEAGVEAIAICFLFSYLDPAHEARAMAIVREEYPGCFATTSSSVSPQFREFERFTTTAMNAFVGPKVRNYVTRLESEIEASGFKADLRIMASNGGVATPAMVAERPVLTLLSGPAAGVIGGDWAGGLSGRRNLITFDVGGTSADIGIVTEGGFGEATARDTWIAGFPVMVPMIDVHTIGAGGGSIAFVDQAGAFKVGPRSAGAVPGPAAYGHGGHGGARPTVTDANVVLGRLDSKNFLGGGMSLDEIAARRVIGDLARELKMGEREAAEGVVMVINANMANAIRSRTVQKGIDPRNYALVAFGGAGPLHGAEVADMLGVPEVIVPPHPGITSAVGLLISDLRYDAIRTSFQVSGAADLLRINADFAAMARELADRFTADGIDLARVSFERRGDLRYVGQGYELRVSFPDGTIDEAALAKGFAAFHEVHKREYGHHFADSAIEIVNLRLVGAASAATIAKPAVGTATSLEAAKVRTGTCTFRVGGK